MQFHIPLLEKYTEVIKKPGLFGKLIPGAKNRYQKAVEAAKLQYDFDFEQYQQNELERKERLQALKSAYDEEKSGFELKVNAATGKDIPPYLISVRVTKENFLQLDLSRVDKSVCLRNLGAQVSSRPAELQAVKPS